MNTLIRFKAYSSSSHTSQNFETNGVDESKNIIVQEMERVVINEAKDPRKFWGEVVQATICISNKSQLRVNSDKTPYELWKWRLATVKHLKSFGGKCYIKINEDNLGEFDSKDDEGIFLGYSSTRKGYQCYNKRLCKIVEIIHVRIDKALPQIGK